MKHWRLILGLLVAVSIAAALSRHGSELRAQMSQLQPRRAPLAWALAVAMIYRLLNSGGWVLALRALRCPLPALAGARLWLISETMRWLPGSVWSYVSRVHAARRAGVDASTAALSISLELLLTLAAWAITAAGGLWLSGGGRFFPRLAPPPLAAAGIAALAIILGCCIGIYHRAWLAAKMPGKVRSLCADFWSLLRRPPRADYCAGALIYYTLLCALNGLNFWLILRALSPVHVSVAAIAGINAIGWLAGFFAFMAPGGLGVREAGIAGMLAAFYPMPVAVGGALIWRFLQIAAELICLLFCLRPPSPAMLAEPA